ncbi:hypothetical protein [Embleya sp. NPDC005971]|uniref:hypothetical protein n=1 Tax=Embleya sp. NPDC005971 TaxID=3156724 RepID=UPI0034006309
MTVYYHGGAPGLARGDELLPPSVTGITHTLTTWAEALGAGPDLTLRDFVYLTTDRDAARLHAAHHPHGDVYRVVPIGPLAADPADPTGNSRRCTRAVVDRVLEAAVPFSAFTLRAKSRPLRKESP